MASVRFVVGLGNPGMRYADTRHNVGFRVVERLTRALIPSVGIECGEGPFLASLARVGETDLVLARPQTFMNRSGGAVAELLERYGGNPDQLIVIYDDADLELGRIRVRPAGGAGGHNGMRSILEVLRTETFPRIRLGIRGTERAEEDLAEYVLEPFEPGERGTADELVALGTGAVIEVVEHGVEAAMNRFNGTRVGRETSGPADVESRKRSEKAD